MGAHARERGHGKDLTENRPRAQGWERATTNLTASVRTRALVISGNGVNSAINLTNYTKRKHHII